MTPDRDTLARDLLTLPALVGAPAEVVRGLVLRMGGEVHPVQDVWRVEGRPRWLVCLAYRVPTFLVDEGWRVDLDAWGSVGPLLGLLGQVRQVQADLHLRRVTVWRAGEPCRPYSGDTLAEAAARALVEVAS